MAKLPVAPVAKIAKNHGAERVGRDAAEELRRAAENRIAELAIEASKLARHAGRKTIKAEDVRLAMERLK